MMFEKTRLHLTIMYSVTIGFILMVMVLLLYFILAQSLKNNTQQQLENATQKAIIEWKLHHGGDAHADDFIPTDKQDIRMDWDFLQSNQFILIHAQSDNSYITSITSDSLESLAQDWLVHHDWPESKSKWIDLNEGSNERVYAVMITTVIPTSTIPETAILVAQDVTDFHRLLLQMKWFLLVFSIILLVVATAVGYFFSGKAMISIRSAYRRQQEFTADASHELRTPLSVLMSSVEILEEQKNNLPPFHHKVLNNMGDEIKRMIRMVEHLLTLARSDAEMPELVKRNFDLRLEMAKVFEQMQPLAKQKNVSLILRDSSPEQHFMYYGDQDKIRQLMVILVDNGIKYNLSGGTVTIELHTGHKRKPEIIISDTGIGIPQKEIPLIFERFYRVHKGRSRELGGTGLGLSIAVWIVEAHGAKLRVTSEPGQGTSFYITL